MLIFYFYCCLPVCLFCTETVKKDVSLYEKYKFHRLTLIMFITPNVQGKQWYFTYSWTRICNQIDCAVIMLNILIIYTSSNRDESFVCYSVQNDSALISWLLLWSPYGIGQTIILSCCYLFFLLSSFFMVALCNRAIGQTIIFSCCGLFFLLPSFSSPNLSRRRLDVCHTSTHGVALV